MTFTLNMKNTFAFGNKFGVIGKLTIASTDTYLAGGIAFDLAALNPLVKSTRVPDWSSIKGISGITYDYVNGTDIHSGKLKIMQAGVEIGNGAPSATIQNDTITLFAIFPGMN